MNVNKKTTILAAILVFLIGLAFLYQGPLKNWQANLGKPKNFLAQVKVDQIDKIDITSRGNTTSLEKQTNPSLGSTGSANSPQANTPQASSEQFRWKIVGSKDFYAATAQMSLVMDDLDQAIKGNLELISNNQEKQKELNTDTSSGIEVKLYKGDIKISDFIIGKLANDFTSTYISDSISPATYLIKSNLYSAFNQSDWRDLTIFSTDKNKVTKVRFQYPNREFTIEKKDDIWQGSLPMQFSVSKDKVDKILEIMTNLSAVKITEQSFTGTGLEKHLIIIQASGDGINNTLMVGTADKDNNYYAKKGDSDNIYLISKEQRDELDKWIWQLK